MDDLVAAAFGRAAGTELDSIIAAVHVNATPLPGLRALVSLLVSQDRDAVSLLWLDAWQASRNKPALRAEVVRQMWAWQEHVTTLIAHGVQTGAFQVSDPPAAAIRILAAIDGLSIQAALRDRVDYAGVRDMVITTIEHELGFECSSLDR